MLNIDPLVSIIVPCYNYAHFLGNTLNSILTQTYSKWECLIIDDGSTDSTASVVKDFIVADPRFKYFYKENGGLSSARNEGLRQASGTYIQFLDSDDLIHKDKLRTQIQIFKQESADIVYSRYSVFLDSLENQSGAYSFISLGHYPLYDFLFRWELDLSIPIHCALFKRSIIGNEVFDESLAAKEDWLFWIDLSMKGANFYNHLDVMAYYRSHTNNMTRNAQEMHLNMIKAMEKIFNKIKNKVPNNLNEYFYYSCMQRFLSHQVEFNVNIESNNFERKIGIIGKSSKQFIFNNFHDTINVHFNNPNKYFELKIRAHYIDETSEIIAHHQYQKKKLCFININQLKEDIVGLSFEHRLDDSSRIYQGQISVIENLLMEKSSNPLVGFGIIFTSSLITNGFKQTIKKTAKKILWFIKKPFYK
jgi:glycosyltransferase involved in cell wall biosynthesis